MAHIISLDNAHARDKDTTEEIEQTLIRRIAAQRKTGGAIARVKKLVFKPVTKLYHTIDQGKIEYTTRGDITTVCIIENIKRFLQTIDTPPMQTYLVGTVAFSSYRIVHALLHFATSINSIGL